MIFSDNNLAILYDVGLSWILIRGKNDSSVPSASSSPLNLRHAKTFAVIAAPHFDHPPSYLKSHFQSQIFWLNHEKTAL